MSARDRDRFYAIRARWVKVDPPSSWLSATERRRLETFRRAQDRASDAMFALLEKIGGRSWRSLVPHHWVMEELSYEDATTRGALSVVPPCGYGARPSDVERFALAIARAEENVR